jgi:Tfp pilus assembly protein PilO
VKKLNSLNFEILKRPRVLGSIAAVVVLAIAFYFAWWAPEGNKLSAVNQTKQQQATTISSLRAQLVQIDIESNFVSRYASFLTFFGNEVPVQPEQGQLVYMLGKLSDSDKVDITQITANATNPATVPGTLSSIPLSMIVSGAHSNIVKFLADLYTMPRLITIQAINPIPAGAPRGTYNVLSRDSVPFQISITGTAYFAGTTAPAA